MTAMKNVAAKIPGTADRQLLQLLEKSGKLPISEEDAIEDGQIKERFPALRRTILKRLIEQGYLLENSGKLALSDKGKQFAQ
jgi:hypothetical protein